MDNGHQYVGDVIKNNYRIPKYQRGYRWTNENVTKLLEDIYEERLYMHDKDENLNINSALNIFRGIAFEYDKDLCLFKVPKNAYCIQPLVIVPARIDDEIKYYDVIDGQQRLTTIAIIRAALKAVGEIGMEPLSLSYESRDKSSDFIRFLYEQVDEPEDKNIDFDYMRQAYNIAKEYYSEILNSVADKDIRTVYANYLDSVICENTQFIWYEIECDKEEPQKVFANFNTGKIELTNSELIKALFMNPSNFRSKNIKDKQIVISEKWDEMENKLHEPEFWAFIPHPLQYQTNADYSTRIDILFDYLVMENWFAENPDKGIEDYLRYRNKNLSDKYIFNEIEGWIKEEITKDNENNGEIIEECWRKVGKIFSGLNELYSSDNKMYNMVGLYINLRNRNVNTVDGYVNDNLLYIKVYYELREILSLKRLERTDKIKCFIKELAYNSDGGSVGDAIRRTRYKEGLSFDIIKNLIIYNIAVLCTSKGTGERYNFLENASNQWEREHIFASNVKEEKMLKQQYIGALQILAGDSYIEYVKYLYNLNDLKIKFKSNNEEYELNIDDEDIARKFIDSNLAYDGNGQNEILARALRSKIIAQELLNCNENIKSINLIMEADKGNEIDVKMHLIKKYLSELRTKFFLLENVDIRLSISFKENIEDMKSNKIFFKELEYEYECSEYQEEWKKWLDTMESENETNYDLIVDKIVSSYQNKLENVLYDKDGNIKKDIDRNNEGFITAALNLSKVTLSHRITTFFESDFSRLLKDNSMGNMTLLTGNKKMTESSGQNQIVSNKTYQEKKNMVYDFFKRGQFVPLGTLLVFTDIYTNENSVANYWLPNSRLNYLKDMIKTTTEFLEEVNENE